MSRRGGYTLLEMMIAIAIFLMIMLTVGMGSVSIQQTWKRVQKHSNSLKMFQMIDRVVSPAFKNAVPFNWKDEDGSTKPVFVGESTSISFAYLHRINRMSEGGIRFLRLIFEDGQLIAQYRNTPLVSWEDDGDTVREEVLSQNIKDVSFSYARMEKDELEWVNVWEEQGYKIPLAIQITIEWENGDVETWLRRTAGAGFKEALNVRN